MKKILTYIFVFATFIISFTGCSETSNSNGPAYEPIVKEVLVDNISIDAKKREIVVTWINVNGFTSDEILDYPQFESKGILPSENTFIGGFNLTEPNELITRIIKDDKPIIYLGGLHEIKISATPNKNGYHDIHSITILKTPDDFNIPIDIYYEAITLDFIGGAGDGIAIRWTDSAGVEWRGFLYNDGGITYDARNDMYRYHDIDLVIGEDYLIETGDYTNGVYEIKDIWYDVR